MQEDKTIQETRDTGMPDETKPPVREAEEDELYDAGSLAYRLRHCSEKTWERVNIIGGIVIGCISAFILFLLPETESLGPMRWALALAVALLVPRIIENSLQRNVYKGKLALLATFGVAFIAYSVLGILGYMK